MSEENFKELTSCYSLRVVTQPQITPHNVLQKPNCLGFHQLVHHVAQDSHDGEETLISVANIRQPCLIKQDFLDDEDRNGFGQLRTGFHDAETKGNDLRREEEVDDGGVVILFDERANHSQ